MHKPPRSPHRGAQAGFTLVELGVVTVIISILAMMSVQAYRRMSIRSRTSIVLNDFRIIGGAMNAYDLEKGAWPASAAPGVMPIAMQGYVTSSNFTSPTVIGGYYTWATNSLQGGTTYQAVIIISSANGNNITADTGQLTDIDKKGDDGNLATGNIFLGASNYLVYVVAK
jgi:prepilin-type N-terminal cleavage/methylation domain-containing protein